MYESKAPIVSVIDYGMGNLFSVEQACLRIGFKTKITSKKKDIMNSDAAILPGVGAFGDAMSNLKKLGLIRTIIDFTKSSKPLMGICLGMQLLFSESEEFGIHTGLDIIKGRVVKFLVGNDQGIKVPQVGWNRIWKPIFLHSDRWLKSPLGSNADGEFMYFVHSFYCKPDSNDAVLSITKYAGIEYCSSLLHKNIFASQFHPEKSGEAGIKIYERFKDLISRDVLND